MFLLFGLGDRRHLVVVIALFVVCGVLFVLCCFSLALLLFVVCFLVEPFLLFIVSFSCSGA